MNIKSVAITIIAVFFILAAGVMIFAEYCGSTLDGVKWAEEEYTVQSGDTLWEIAAGYCPQGVDLREWIHEVEKINGIDGYIYAGDKITVLIPD